MEVSIVITKYMFDYEIEQDHVVTNTTLFICDEITELTKNLKELHERYAKRAIEVYSGRNRNVFRMPGGYVVKIPTCMDGIADNDWEGSLSNSEEGTGFDIGYIQYARTRMGYYKDIPIVFMEYVEFLPSSKIKERYGKQPDWCWSVDCGQVGSNKYGRLVAFDYGCR